MKNHLITFKSDDLIEKSLGLKFKLPHLGDFTTGFVVRFLGKPYAYINQCAHIPVELDWKAGEFFTQEKDYIICATHGAQYEPDTGHCVAGPCKGKKLKPLMVEEVNNTIIININGLKNNT